MTRFVAIAVATSNRRSSCRKSSKVLPIWVFFMVQSDRNWESLRLAVMRSAVQKNTTSRIGRRRSCSWPAGAMKKCINIGTPEGEAARSLGACLHQRRRRSWPEQEAANTDLRIPQIGPVFRPLDGEAGNAGKTEPAHGSH